MKYIISCLFLLAAFILPTHAQQKDPWTSAQLMEPGTLAARINAGQTKDLVVLCIGPGALVKGSVDIGPAHEAAGLQHLKAYLQQVDRSKTVVIYCGCCPFDKCPNIRPAFAELTAMGFKNARLLDLPRNLKADWLDKGYPKQ
ncbi:hypothetical protein DCC81_20425 [Chitinophaga parva]|uniref:Rhodanese-like domain-containing protein n=1 Tax=Chitinophaga parva TaxID=2169414 RepID=A0A2T7BCJ2_9BACT|nr:rhodanese-like domain-containing protein [Chitinophaga parva]PUZ22795.1 hypothetical protein DCC81_20425 [Chitinophaga parva]